MPSTGCPKTPIRRRSRRLANGAPNGGVMCADRGGFSRWTAVGLSGCIIALAEERSSAAMGSTGTGQSAARGIVRLRLQTQRLLELRAFYREKLQFPIREETSDSITFQAG